MVNILLLHVVYVSRLGVRLLVLAASRLLTLAFLETPPDVWCLISQMSSE